MGYKKWIFIIIISLCAFTLFKCLNTSAAKNLCLRIKVVNNLTNEPISDVKILVEEIDESILGYPLVDSKVKAYKIYSFPEKGGRSFTKMIGIKYTDNSGMVSFYTNKTGKIQLKTNRGRCIKELEA